MSKSYGWSRPDRRAHLATPPSLRIIAARPARRPRWRSRPRSIPGAPRRPTEVNQGDIFVTAPGRTQTCRTFRSRFRRSTPTRCRIAARPTYVSSTSSLLATRFPRPAPSQRFGRIRGIGTVGDNPTPTARSRSYRRRLRSTKRIGLNERGGDRASRGASRSEGHPVRREQTLGRPVNIISKKRASLDMEGFVEAS